MKSKLLVLGLLILILFLLIPGVALGWIPYGFGPPMEAAYPGSGNVPVRPAARHFRVARDADQNNYYMTVHVTGMTPQEVTVTLEGDRWLAVRTASTSEYTYEDIAPDRNAYARSFSYRTGSAARRFTLPRDADPAAMKREDGENQVRIVIPRLR